MALSNLAGWTAKMSSPFPAALVGLVTSRRRNLQPAALAISRRRSLQLAVLPMAQEISNPSCS